jgi:hypothetical protein
VPARAAPVLPLPIKVADRDEDLMRHIRLLLIVLVSLGFAAPAAAQGWGRGWFERWSGPGAFYGTDVRLDIGCIPQTEARFDPPWKGRSTLVEEPALFCLDAEFSTYANEDIDRAKHGIVSFDRYHLLAMYVVPGNRLQGMLELGAGLGSITFRGNTYEFDRQYLPLRAVLKPFRIAASSEERRPVLGIFQIVATLLYFPESVRHQDFNIVPVVPEDNFKHHLHPNISLMVDFSSFLFNR